MEGGTHVGKTMGGRGKFHDSLNAGLVRGEPKEAVIGSDEAGAGAGLDGDWRTHGADPRIDNRQEYGARREVAPGFAQNDSAGRNGLRRDAVGDVDDGGSRSDRGDHALHHTCIVVAVAKVRYYGKWKGASRDRRHQRSRRETSPSRNLLEPV